METKLASAQKKISVATVINQLRMLLVLIGLVAIFSILSPHFLSANNFSAIGLTISVIGGRPLARGRGLKLGCAADRASAPDVARSHAGVD